MMKDSKNIIAIIPARGGSKGIPKKNLIPFCGKPLVAWSILQAKESRYISDVYVSSDHVEILKVSRQYGAKAIRRPKPLSTDKASSEAALLHVIDQVESVSSRKIDLVVFLQATSPVRTAEDIDCAIELLEKEEGDSLFAAAVLHSISLWSNNDGKFRSMTYDYKNRGRRQDRTPFYLENGSIYVFKPKILRKFNNRLGGKITMYPMEFSRSYEIDDVKDVEICEYFMKRLLKWI